MDTKLFSFLSFSLLVILFFLSNHVNAYGYNVSPSTTNPFDFIRSSCNTTLYPNRCYTSLSHYANDVQQDPARLARTAIWVSLVRARRTVGQFSNMTHLSDYGPDQRAASALRDCCSTFRDAVGQMKDSLGQMRRMAGGGEELKFQLSNVQTWMSAALTNEDTCSDGFQDVGSDSMKDDVCGRVAVVKELTSNALALVNSFANSVSS